MTVITFRTKYPQRRMHHSDPFVSPVITIHWGGSPRPPRAAKCAFQIARLFYISNGAIIILCACVRRSSVSHMAKINIKI